MHNTTKTRTDNFAFLLNQSIPFLSLMGGAILTVVAALPIVPDSRVTIISSGSTLLLGISGGAYTQKKNQSSTINEENNEYNLYQKPQNVYQMEQGVPRQFTPPRYESQEDWVAPEYRK